MKTDTRYPSAVDVTSYTYPYQPSISSSASSSASSIFSADANSQSSEPSVYSSRSGGSEKISWDSEDPWRSTLCRDEVPPTVNRILPPIQACEPAVALEQRQHPRRCSLSAQKQPPALIRQSERKGQFVECLVDSATQMVEVIWPLSVPHCPGDSIRSGVLPLRTFIQETLRRSRTSFSTLQVALYYLILIKAHVPRCDFTMEQLDDLSSTRALQCGRRMFLAALILASKYLQDRNYSARAWSRISGLKTEEINTNEMAFLQAVKWKLHVPEGMFERWQDILIKYTSHTPSTPGSPMVGSMMSEWKLVVPRLTPALDTVDIIARKPFNLVYPEPRKTCPVPPRFMETSSSQESTPTPSTPTSVPPRFLEPSPHMLPPTPSLVRMGRLPTPMLTPQLTASITPAVSVAGFGSHRPSMCSAMSQAQNVCVARSTMDYNWGNKSYSDLAAYRLSARRPSVQSISGCSLTSSPESMISDNSSRSSRASSISSASSLSSAHAWAPKLNRLATLRCAGLPCPMLASQQPLPQKEPETVYIGSYSNEPIVAEPMSSPDMDVLRLSDGPATLPIRQRDVSQRDSPNKGRKRGRSSVDLTLQENVRGFLDSRARPYHADPSCAVVTDRSVAEPSMFLQSPCRTPTYSEYAAKALQSPARSVPERRLPIQKDFGRKRACASEARDLMTFTAGPGQWAGIL